MSRLLVTGGRQKAARSMTDWKEGSYLDVATILEVDFDAKTITRRYEIDDVDSSTYCDTYSVTFKSASLVDGRLYVSTHSTAYVVDVETFTVIESFTHPLMNDVHYVLPEGDDLWLANTGLDHVGRLDTRTGEMELIPAHSPATHIDPSIDYRTVSTKPHACHPNFVFRRDDKLWVTRFEQRDAVSLDLEDRIPIDVGMPHDGHVAGQDIYFTTVNGHVVRVDDHGERTDFDVDACYERVRPGWCRGVLVEPPHLYIGYTVLRTTKIRKNVAWVKNRFARNLPTRIVRYNMDTRRIEDEMSFEAGELDAVFSILRVG